MDTNVGQELTSSATSTTRIVERSAIPCKLLKAVLADRRKMENFSGALGRKNQCIKAEHGVKHGDGEVGAVAVFVIIAVVVGAVDVGVGVGVGVGFCVGVDGVGIWRCWCWCCYCPCGDTTRIEKREGRNSELSEKRNCG
jgi:hypothetical protein